MELGYFHYEIIHKKLQYDLLTLLKTEVPTPEMGTLINELYAKYPKGLVAHVTKGTVPERCRGLAKYLAKYVASPPHSGAADTILHGQRSNLLVSGPPDQK